MSQNSSLLGQCLDGDSKEERRIRSGAYGKPKRVPVRDLFTDEHLGWSWERPNGPDAIFLLNV